MHIDSVSDTLSVSGRSHSHVVCRRGEEGYANYDAMRFGLRLATSKKARVIFLPPLHANEFSQGAPHGLALDTKKCMFVQFLVERKEI